mgnify:CR=1 FL=1
MKKKHQSAAEKRQVKKLKNQEKAQKYASEPSPLQSDTAGVECSQKKTVVSHIASSKTLAKAMGLKSTLVMGDKLVITSFAASKAVGGAGYKSANIEKITDLQGRVIEEHERMFSADVGEKNIELSKNDCHTNVNNPVVTNIGKDYIGLKSRLEQEFFGKTFENDNLHVQLAYNILDIKKILGTYVNNIIYIFYNLNRAGTGRDERMYDDLIGTLYAYKPMEAQQTYLLKGDKDMRRFEEVKQLLQNTSAYYVYYGTLFEKVKAKSKKEQRAKEAEIDACTAHNYDVLRLLSLMRQLCMHSVAGTAFKLAESALFNIEDVLSADLKEILDEAFSGAVNKLNDGFVQHSGNNLYVLQQLYPNETIERIAEKYYRLTVRKEDLNMGVNIKKLRELIVGQYFPEVLDKEYDLSKNGDSVVTYRSKIYTVMNYILLYYLEDHDSSRESMVEALRQNREGDEGKEEIYRQFAKKVWNGVSGLFGVCLNLFKTEKRNKFRSKVALPDVSGAAYMLSSENIDYFVKMLFFVCKFLDGKEINELLCALINKFDNIADILDAAAQCGSSVWFVDSYRFFERSRRISAQIRIVKNIASKDFKKSKKDSDESYPEQLYLDALALLGDVISKYKQNRDGSVVIDDQGNAVLTEQYKRFRYEFFEEIKRDESGGIKYKKSGKPEYNHQRRNFILNNVLKSKWFFYVVKYNRPSSCRELMKNKEILRFVLRDIPDSQVRRYFKAVQGEEAYASAEAMRTRLVDALSQFSVTACLDEVGGMTDKEFASQRAVDSKEKLRAIIRLYLTVAYLITKSMVKVNTRFSIAFSVLERDYYLLIDGKKKSSDYTGEDMLALTRKFVGEDAGLYREWKEKNAEAKDKYFDKAERKKVLRQNDKMIRKMHFTPHSLNYVQKNLESVQSNGLAAVIKEYRNAVAHLNIINRLDEYIGSARADSYYSLYCYCLQMYLSKNFSVGYLINVQKQLEEHHTYMKDLMWLLNIPFAYNLARYKNLSNEKLFYDEEAAAEKADKAENERGE